MPKEEITIESYEKLAEENKQTLKEIQENKLPSVISEKAKKTIIKTVKGVLAAGMVGGVAVPLAACKEAPSVEINQETNVSQETNSPTETTEEIPSTIETIPETTAEIKKVDAPEIKGQTFSYIFNQENKTYVNEKTGEIAGFLIEDAVNIEGKLGPAIVLNAEALNKVLVENKEKGIFKFPWPFNFQENKGTEMVKLIKNPLVAEKTFKQIGIYMPYGIGIKYSEPISLYAIFDIGKSMGHLVENIPNKEVSASPYKSLSFGNNSFGGLQYDFIDWEPRVELGKAETVSNNRAYLQEILGTFKCGDFLGEILPKTSDFNFLDFLNNEESLENPGQFQGRLLITTFNDDLSKKTSSLEKMLTYLNKAGQEIPVGVWPEENTAHEQTN